MRRTVIGCCANVVKVKALGLSLLYHVAALNSYTVTKMRLHHVFRQTFGDHYLPPFSIVG